MNHELPTHEKMVLLVLANCHNADTKRCDPSQDYIANKSGMTRRSVIKQMDKLEAKGLLTRQRRSHTSNFYTLNVNVVHIGKIKGGEPGALNLVNEVHIPSERGSHKTVIETVIEPSTASDDGFDRFWDAYPSRHPHSNKKQAAHTAFRAQIKLGTEDTRLISGAFSYGEHCKKEGIEPRYIMQAATFLNGREWEEWGTADLPAHVKVDWA